MASEWCAGGEAAVWVWLSCGGSGVLRRVEQIQLARRSLYTQRKLFPARFVLHLGARRPKPSWLFVCGGVSLTSISLPGYERIIPRAVPWQASPAHVPIDSTLVIDLACACIACVSLTVAHAPPRAIAHSRS
jgi:hypothetical protein